MFRIDNLTPGTTVCLAFHKRATTTMTKGGRIDEEEFVFVGIEGTGDDRRAKFAYPTTLVGNDLGSVALTNTWEAYRMNNHWVFGSSAERLSLVAVKA